MRCGSLNELVYVTNKNSHHIQVFSVSGEHNYCLLCPPNVEAVPSVAIGHVTCYASEVPSNPSSSGRHTKPILCVCDEWNHRVVSYDVSSLESHRRNVGRFALPGDNISSTLQTSRRALHVSLSTLPFHAQFGGHGSASSDLNHPCSVAVADYCDGQRPNQPCEVFVCDWGNHRVQVLELLCSCHCKSSGAEHSLVLVPVRRWGCFGDEQGQFRHPTAVAVVAQPSLPVRSLLCGHANELPIEFPASQPRASLSPQAHGAAVYICDGGRSLGPARIQQFCGAGCFLRQWNAGASLQTFLDQVHPYASHLSADCFGMVYASVHFHNRSSIEIYSTTGTLLQCIDSLPLVLPPAVPLDPLHEENAEAAAPAPGIPDTRLLASSRSMGFRSQDISSLFPSGIAVTAEGTLLICDTGRFPHKVSVCR